MADSIKNFVKGCNLEGDNELPLPLGFTFSYPALQERIDHGVLVTWTKGWEIRGVEGENVVAQLQAALDKRVS